MFFRVLCETFASSAVKRCFSLDYSDDLSRGRPVPHQLRRRPGAVPDPPGPAGGLGDHHLRVSRRAVPRQRVPLACDPDPVRDPGDRRDRPQHPRWLLRPDLACLRTGAAASGTPVRALIRRRWMLPCEMVIDADLIGSRPVRGELSELAVGRFVIRVSGALWAFVHLGSWEPLAFSIVRSFELV